MIARFFRNLFGNVPVEFPSAFPLEDSVRRLREQTKRPEFLSLPRQSAVGRVTTNEVRLRRVTPSLVNPFKPIFAGRFFIKDGQVILGGRFTMFLFSKLFVTAWFTILAIASVIALLNEVGLAGFQADVPPERLLAVLFIFMPVGFFLVGGLFIKFCWSLSRRDIQYIEAVITAALASQHLTAG